MKKNFIDWWELFSWKILKHSPVFRYIWKKFLAEVIYDLEIADLEQDDLLKKWRARYQKALIL